MAWIDGPPLTIEGRRLFITAIVNARARNRGVEPGSLIRRMDWEPIYAATTRKGLLEAMRYSMDAALVARCVCGFAHA